MITLTKSIVLCLSLLGYAIFIRKKIKSIFEFIPISLFCSIILLMYIAGLLNILLFMICAIVIVGTLLFFYYMFSPKNRIKKEELKTYITINNIIFISIIVFFALWFRNVPLLSYDNFSHWATIVKDMQMNNRLPNFSSGIIFFPAYPPGSALFIYFINKLIGFSDGRMLFVQFILIISSLFCLFAFCKPRNSEKENNKTELIKRIIITLLITLSTIYFLNGPTGIYGLLVDTLVLTLGVAGLIIVIYYKDEIVKAVILSTPVFCATILVKNSGIFYVLIALVYLLYLLIKKKEKKGKMAVLVAFILPIIFFTLWQQHVKLVFPKDATESKHAMTLVNYEKVFSEKSDKDISNITHAFVNKTINVNENTSVQKMLYWNIGTILLYILLRLLKRKEKNLILSLIFVDIIFSLYLMGLYAMYLFSMPEGEALVLASYGRYLGMITLYLEAILLINLVIVIQKHDTPKKSISICLVLLGLFLFFFFSNITGIRSVFARPEYAGSRRQQIERAFEYKNNKFSYLVYAPRSANDLGYLHYFLRYFLWEKEPNIVFKINSDKEFYVKLKSCDYLVIIDEDENIKKFMKNHSDKEGTVGTYSVKQMLH